MKVHTIMVLMTDNVKNHMQLSDDSELGFHSLCKIYPKTTHHKWQYYQLLPDCYDEEDNAFRERIITEGETWIHHSSLSPVSWQGVVVGSMCNWTPELFPLYIWVESQRRIHSWACLKQVGLAGPISPSQTTAIILQFEGSPWSRAHGHWPYKKVYLPFDSSL